MSVSASSMTARGRRPFDRHRIPRQRCSLPEDARRGKVYWHDHKYEVDSGLLKSITQTGADEKKRSPRFALSGARSFTHLGVGQSVPHRNGLAVLEPSPGRNRSSSHLTQNSGGTRQRRRRSSQLLLFRLLAFRLGLLDRLAVSERSGVSSDNVFAAGQPRQDFGAFPSLSPNWISAIGPAVRDNHAERLSPSLTTAVVGRVNASLCSSAMIVVYA